jgi:hypothetical protein
MSINSLASFQPGKFLDFDWCSADADEKTDIKVNGEGYQGFNIASIACG